MLSAQCTHAEKHLFLGLTFLFGTVQGRVLFVYGAHLSFLRNPAAESVSLLKESYQLL